MVWRLSETELRPQLRLHQLYSSTIFYNIKDRNVITTAILQFKTLVFAVIFLSTVIILTQVTHAKPKMQTGPTNHKSQKELHKLRLQPYRFIQTFDHVSTALIVSRSFYIWKK